MPGVPDLEAGPVLAGTDDADDLDDALNFIHGGLRRGGEAIDDPVALDAELAETFMHAGCTEARENGQSLDG